MGRPRLYHSPEEKAAANRTKSKHHYDRDKSEINSRRRKVYRKQKKQALPIEPLPFTGEIKPELSREESALAAWLERADSAERRLHKILGGIDPVPFVEQICKTYLWDQSWTCLEAQVSSLARLQKSLYKYQNEVYSLTGVGPEHKRMEALVGRIRTAVTLAEEVSCFAMLGPNEVYRMHAGKEFMYQDAQVSQ